MASQFPASGMSAITPEFQKAVREEGQLVLQTTLQAGMLREEGRYEEAANLCKQVLDRDLMKKYGAVNPQALGTLHEYLGDTLRMYGKHDEARLHLEKALHIQDAIEYGGLGKGERKDGAMCRERLAYVMEAQGRMDEARALRLKGEAKGEILCSNISVCSVHTTPRILTDMTLASATVHSEVEATSAPVQAVVRSFTALWYARRWTGRSDTRSPARLIRRSRRPRAKLQPRPSREGASHLFLLAV